MHLLTEQDLTDLKKRFTMPAFQPVIKKLQAVTAEQMERPLNIPTQGAGWFHNYTCPTHAAPLIYDVNKPHEHVCPVDGEVFSGGIYDEAWLFQRNHDLIRSAYAAAVLWHMSGEAAYRDHAVAVLTGYAEVYPSMPVHGDHAGKGRLMGQSLDEAVWAVPAAWTFDIVRDSLTPEEETHIRENLMVGLGEHLLTQLWDLIHNIQCWHLAGLASVGTVLDEDRFIQPTFHAKFGFAAQLEQGTQDDGWWWEGSPHYHFYTSQAVTSLCLALRYRHPELLENPRLQRMFIAPLEMLRPDFSVPSLNDGWFNCAYTGGIAQYVDVFERVYNFWGKDVHAQAMAHIYAKYTQRDGIDALLFGPAALPEPAPLPAESCVQSGSGYAILKSSDGQRNLMLKYGPHGGGHGHPDKLALVLWAHGELLSPDLGTPGYGIAMNNTWYRHTLAHNTVLIDGEKQPWLTGELLRFEEKDGYTLVEAVANFPESEEAPYTGVKLRRVILWRDSYFIDLVTVDSPQPRQIDLAWHHTGDLSLDGLAPADITLEKEGYAHLKNIRVTDAGAWQATWRSANGPGSTMWALNAADAQTLVTDAPYNPASETMSLILRRINGAAAVYLSVVEPFAAHPAITAVEWMPGENTTTVTVRGEDFADSWELDHRAGTYQLQPQ